MSQWQPSTRSHFTVGSSASEAVLTPAGPLFHKRSPRSERPASERTKDFKIVRRKASSRFRPASAHRSQVSRRSKVLIDGQPLKPPTGRSVCSRLEMESLYESNLALKSQFNQTSEENVKLKTLVKRLQTENQQIELVIDELSGRPNKRVQPMVKKLNLIRGLKNANRDLKMELSRLAEENEQLQKNIRSTKQIEAEIEVQSYAQECIRLRRHLEQLLLASGMAMDGDADASEEVQQIIRSSSDAAEVESGESNLNLRRENQELHNALQRTRNEMDRWRQQAMDLQMKFDQQQTATAAMKKRAPQRNRRANSNRASDGTGKVVAEDELVRQRAVIAQLNTTVAAQKKEIQEHLRQIEHLKTQLGPEQVVDLPPDASSITIAPPDGTPIPAFSETDIIPPPDTLFDPTPTTTLDPKVLTLVQKTIRQCSKRGITHEKLFRKFDKKNAGLLTSGDLVTGFRQAGVKSDMFTVEKLFAVICGPGQDTITIGELCEWFDGQEVGAEGDQSSNVEDHRSSTGSHPPATTHSPGSESDTSSHNLLKVTKEDVKDILQHISLRMQLHRLPKSKLLVSLFGQNFDKEREISITEFAELMRGKPFAFEDQAQCITLARYLMEPPNDHMFTTKLEIDALSATAKDLGGKLFLELEEWEVFKPEDEKQFDKEIADVISHNKLSFKECCKSYDTEGVGFINVEDFMDTLETLELEFDESCLRYMLLLFYSHSFDLNRVPYKQFIKAYSTLEVSQHESTEVEESSIDEEERAAVVRDCLTKISEAIGKRQPNQFWTATNGRLYPNELLQGLRAAGVADFAKQDFITFMESLQCEEEEEDLCVDYPYLESLLLHYQRSEHSSSKPDQNISVLDEPGAAGETGQPEGDEVSSLSESEQRRLLDASNQLKREASERALVPADSLSTPEPDKASHSNESVPEDYEDDFDT